MPDLDKEIDRVQHGLTDEQQQIFSQGAELARKFDRDYWNDHAERAQFPFELWAELGRSGLLGTLVPEEFGGRGLGITEMALLTEGLATRGFPLLTLITGPGLALPVIARHGTDRQRRDVLPALLSGDAVIAFAITEADVGSNLMRLRTRAEPASEGLLLSGTKNYTSVADVASHVMVISRTPMPNAKEGQPEGFTVALVPMDSPGLTRELADTQVPGPERQCTLTFREVPLGADEVVGEPGLGLRAVASAIVNERALSAALACGVGQYALDRAVEFAKGRVVHDAPIATHQAVQHPLARSAIELEGARLLIRKACSLADSGQRADGAANMAAYAASRAGFRAADAALQAHGGFGYTRTGDIYAAYQLARLMRSAPVSAESALNAVGETVLGLPRSY